MATENKEQIWAALAAVQSQIKTQPHTREVSVGKYAYTYTELSALCDYLMPILSAAGIATTYTSEPVGAASLRISCRLTAADGSHVEAATVIDPGNPDAQSVGKVLTYGRRYCLQMVTGIATESDTDCDTESDTDCAPSDATHKPTQSAGRLVPPPSQATQAQTAEYPNAMSEKQRGALWAIISKKAPQDATPDEKKALLEVGARRACGVELKAIDKRSASMLIEWLDNATPADFAQPEKDEVSF